MRRFLPALAALLLLLTLCACTKPSEEPTPSPAPPAEETQNPKSTKRIAVSPATGDGRQLIFECPADWESDGYNDIDYQGRKLIEIYYTPAEEQRAYMQKWDDIQIKQLGEREFYTSSAEYGILESPEMTPGVEETKVCLYTIWSYYFFDGEDSYGIALFENQEREQIISVTDFEEILAGLEIEKPLETTENAVGYEKMALGGFSLWLPEGTVYRENTIYEDDSDLARRIATVEGFKAIEDKAAPFAVYDEKYSDAHRVEEHEFGGYAAKSYHRQIEVTDTAIPGFINLTEYCIDVGDEMLVVTFYKMRVGGYSPLAQDDDFVRVLNSIEVG